MAAQTYVRFTIQMDPSMPVSLLLLAALFLWSIPHVCDENERVYCNTGQLMMSWRKMNWCIGGE